MQSKTIEKQIKKETDGQVFFTRIIREFEDHDEPMFWG